MRYVESLQVLETLLRRDRPSGVVRLVERDEDKARSALMEVRKVESVYPALPILLVHGTIDDDESEARTLRYLEARGVRDSLLLLPLWWALWEGRIVAVYRQGGMIVRDLVGMLGGKDAADGVVDWIHRTLRAERGTGRLPRPRPRPQPRAPGAERTTGSGEASSTRGAQRAPSSAREARGAAAGSGGAGREPADRASGRRDPYAVLGVRRDASAEEIRKAYRLLCARYHPDKLAHKGNREQEAAHRWIVEINGAYDEIRKTRAGPR